ncbi:adenylate/guanylate cyclase domain-containing protein [Desulfosarcina sp.]|uniref:adenylate/guanylate cyclase domain-containing protein n=1 Tax=Desulfosarcina sp. TaxID=2027861 RepID=UPI003970B85E
MNIKRIKISVIIFLLAAVAVVHHLPIHGFLGTHILHRDLFFFPIVLAGLWFGLRTALVTAVAASIVYAHFFYHNISSGRISMAVVVLQVAGFNLMALLTGWMVDRQRRQEQERDFLNDTFGKYVSRTVRDEILGGRVTLSGELKEVTVLFADLRDFTRLVETTPPREVVTIINTYFKAMAEAINAHHGLVIQFIGDEIEAVFGAPVALENHQQYAVDAALDMRTRLSQVNLNLANQGFPTLRHGIGIHTGKVVAANIGSDHRLSYALVGETVNIASRIQSLNKDFDTDILISAAVRKGLDRSVAMQSLPPATVKGVGEPLQLFSIVAQPFVCVE